LSLPASPPTVPTVVARFAAGRPVRAIWLNELGGVTFRVGPGPSGAEFIKVAYADIGDFAAEAQRLRWAARYVTVPHVLGWGLEGVGRGCGPARCPACRRCTRDGWRRRTSPCGR
jgi:kanamycin kinase